MPLDTLTIVGVGLIGGSLGLAAKERGVAARVVGVGRDARTLERAQALGALDGWELDLAAGVRAADLVVVCTPVDRVAADILECVRHAPKRAVVTDAGSTKRGIVEAVAAGWPADAAFFVGSHPLAGSEKKGAAHARADLLVDRVVVVTPTAATDPEAAAFVEKFWRALGARVVRMDPGEHDEALAVTSHLPHAAAAALAAVTPREWLGLTAGGFRDCTRVAGGDPELWAAIFAANRGPVLGALEQLQARLDALKRALERGDGPAVAAWLAEAKQVRDALGS